jgi:hypothetical protein
MGSGRVFSGFPGYPPKFYAAQAMTETTHAPDTERSRPGRGRTTSPWSDGRIRLGAVIVLALLVGLVAWIVLRHTGNSSTTAVSGTPAEAVSPRVLASLATSTGIPIYWAGPKPGYTLEYTRSSGNNVYLRYLPAGVAVGSTHAYLTIGTYPFANAYTVSRSLSQQAGRTTIAVKGGVAFYKSSTPDDIYFAFPGSNYQIEVYDPTPGEARSLVASGQVVPVTRGAASTTESAAHAVSATALDALAGSLQQPIYWLGAEKGVTYELTQTVGGMIYLRYLPHGVPVGSTAAYLTVGTYPVKNAYSVVKSLVEGSGWVKVDAPGNAVAGYDKSDPTSVYVAFPGSSFQIEIYSPDAARAKSLASSGRLVAVG